MPRYISGKLTEIREHAKELLETRDVPEEERNQHYFWILNAAGSIESKLEGIEGMLNAFMKIEEIVAKGGEPVFVVRQIDRIITECKRGSR